MYILWEKNEINSQISIVCLSELQDYGDLNCIIYFKKKKQNFSSKLALFL